MVIICFYEFRDIIKHFMPVALLFLNPWRAAFIPEVVRWLLSLHIYFLIPGKEKIRNFKSCFSEKVHLYLQRKVHLYLQRIPLSSNVHSCLTAQKQTRPHLTGREQREQSIHFLALLIEESKRESDWLGNSLCSFILPYVGRAYCV